MKKEDVFNVLVRIANSFLCKRNGICNCYWHDDENHVFIKHPVKLSNSCHRLVFMAMNEERIETTNKFPRVWVTDLGNEFDLCIDQVNEDLLVAMKISFTGEIVQVYLGGHILAGRILEEIIPMFTDKMHILRYLK